MNILRVTLIVWSLVVEIALGLSQCNRTGIFPSNRPEKFALCRMESSALIKSEFSCSNDTIYSGNGAQCISTRNRNNIFHYYNLMDLNARNQAEVTLKCVSPGTICSDCNTLSVCAGDMNPDGELILSMISNTTCAKGQHCAIGKGCTFNSLYPCSSAQFQCDDTGVFPDPFDCQKYHFCDSSSLHKTYKCPSGSFNAATATCGFSMQSNACTLRPVPLCRKLFQLGQVTDTPNMYYICVLSRTEAGTLTPSLHRCPPNLIFDTDKKSCV